LPIRSSLEERWPQGQPAEPWHAADGLRPRLIPALAVHRKSLRAQTTEGETSGMRHVEFDFSKLSVAERIQLAEDLWDSIPESADIPLTDAQRAELDRRLDDLEQHPDSGEPWEAVRARLYGRLKRGE
jgi:putative addiction module component (TIGR02574 family)